MPAGPKSPRNRHLAMMACLSHPKRCGLPAVPGRQIASLKHRMKTMEPPRVPEVQLGSFGTNFNATPFMQ